MKPLDAYIRVSDVAGREGERYISPTEQRRTIEAAATRAGVKVAEVVIEENVSGSRPADKRRLGELLERCERGESAGIIVSNVDRLTRASKLEEAKIMDRLANAGARLIVANEGIDTDAPGAELTLDILAALARAQWRRHQANWKQARSRAIDRGAYPAQTPWGYTRDTEGRIHPDPQLAPIVRELFQRRADGAGIAELGRWLTAQRVKAPNGKGTSWSQSTVSQILRNPVYLGCQKHGDFERRDAHEPILCETEFDAAQVAKRTNKTNHQRPRNHSAGALLPGLARCAGCGHTLKIVTGYNETLRYYCKGPYTTGECPARCLVRVDELDPWVEQWFLAAIKNNVRVASAVAANERAEKTQVAVDQAERELEAYVVNASALDAPLFKRGLGDRQRKLELARLDHAEALSEVRTYGSVPSGDLLASWPGLSIEHKRRLLAAFFDAVNVSRGNGNVAERVQFVREGVAVWPAEAPSSRPSSVKIGRK